jgi:hypothetical protein
VADEIRSRPYRDDLQAAYQRIAELERQLALRDAEDPAKQMLVSLDRERAALAARGPTELTRAERALPNLVIVPFGSLAFGTFVIGLWWLSAMFIALGAAICAMVRALVRRRADVHHGEISRLDVRIAELKRLRAEATGDRSDR